MTFSHMFFIGNIVVVIFNNAYSMENVARFD